MADRVALVTGGTGALGRAVVRRFIEASYPVHVPWVVESEVDELRSYLGDAAGGLTLHEADVTDERSVSGLVAAIERKAAPVTILANIVGGFRMASIEETTLTDWQKMLELNATSAFLCSRAVVPGMKRAKSGRIVNVTAQPALTRGAKNMAAYAAAKAAVLNFTESLSKELVGSGITVNAIAPTTIDTEANRKSMPDADRSTWLEPEEIAEVIAFLVSEAAGVVTGTAVNLNVRRETT